VEWPKVSVNAALEDYDLMALYQLGLCSNMLAQGEGGLMCVRCNYGTSIIPSLFGVRLFVMDEELDTLPTSYPLGDTEKIRAVVESGVPNVYSGYGERVFEMGRRYAEIMAPYPNICRYVHVYHPDVQGPLDVCEVLWGSGILTQFYEDPGLVKALLELVTETYIVFLREWQRSFPSSDGRAVHWSMLHRGHIMLRDDSAMNLSPPLYEEFVKPYDQRLLDEFGGGAIHFCGRGDHFIESMSDTKGLYAVNMSQPEYNDMEVIYRNTIDKGIALVGLDRDAAETALRRGRDLHGRVHVAPAVS